MNAQMDCLFEDVGIWDAHLAAYSQIWEWHGLHQYCITIIYINGACFYTAQYVSTEKSAGRKSPFHSILFYSILFYSILFYSINMQTC